MKHLKDVIYESKQILESNQYNQNDDDQNKDDKKSNKKDDKNKGDLQ